MKLAIAAAAAALVAVAGAALFYLAQDEAGGVHPPLAFEDAAVVAEGKVIYAAQCASCHGADLEGEPDWRRPKPNGRMPAPPHDHSGHSWHHDDATLFAITKRGLAAMLGPDSQYQSDMPAYGDVLSDVQIAAVLAYIKSTWPAHLQVTQSRGRTD